MAFEKDRLTTLGAVLDAVDDRDWQDDSLYLGASREDWSPATDAAVVTWDLYEVPPDDLAVEGVELRYTLAGFQVLEIVANLRAQEAPTTERLIDALRYYHKFDSFIE